MPKPTKNDAVYLTLLLQCPGIHLAPAVVTTVVQESLLGFILNNGSDDTWAFEEEHWYSMHQKLFDNNGEVQLAAQGEEYWDFMLDPEGSQVRYCDQAERLLHSFHVDNLPKLEALHADVGVLDVKVIRAYRNQWLLGITGHRNPR